MTLAEHGYQPRLVVAVRDYLTRDVADGRIQCPLPVDDLAYASVRITESYYYLPTIAGRAQTPTAPNAS